MTASRQWRVYIEVRTPLLQNAEDLQWLERALESHADVATAVPTVGSRGSRFSLTATIVVHADNTDAAAERARTVFYDACHTAGYTIGELLQSAVEPADASPP